MRRLGAVTALVLAGSLGVAAGAVPVASGDGQTQTCQSSTSSTPTSTTTTTQTTSTSTTTTTTTPAPTLPPPQGRPRNVVWVENCNDGTIKARSRLQVAVASPTNADPGNYAYAYAHDCSNGCDAIAAAFQVALIPNGAQRQTPENVALAINYNCNYCGAFAYAYQYAVDVPRGTRLSAATRRQIGAIRREAAVDIRAGFAFPELDSRLKALATRLKAAVDDGLKKQRVRETDRRSSEHLKERGRR